MSTITWTTIYQDDVQITCKCGEPMKFHYTEFALSSFNCDKCKSTFVHDDWNEPNEKNITRRRKEGKYDKRL